MSDLKRSQAAAGALVPPQLYSFILTDEGPILYRDLLLWRQALDAERASFCARPIRMRNLARPVRHERSSQSDKARAPRGRLSST